MISFIAPRPKSATLNLKIEPELLARLHEVAEREDRPLARVVRAALERALDGDGPPAEGS